MRGFDMTAADPLLGLGTWLQQRGYRFVTPTPATHARVNARPGAGVAQSLQDVFGWSRWFSPALLPRPVLKCLEDGDIVEPRIRTYSARSSMFRLMCRLTASRPWLSS